MRCKENASAAVAKILTLMLLVPSVAAIAQNSKPVKVDVKCPNQEDGRFTISVKPYTVVVDATEGIEWDLDIDDKKVCGPAFKVGSDPLIIEIV